MTFHPVKAWVEGAQRHGVTAGGSRPPFLPPVLSHHFYWWGFAPNVKYITRCRWFLSYRKLFVAYFRHHRSTKNFQCIVSKQGTHWKADPLPSPTYIQIVGETKTAPIMSQGTDWLQSLSKSQCYLIRKTLTGLIFQMLFGCQDSHGFHACSLHLWLCRSFLHYPIKSVLHKASVITVLIWIARHGVGVGPGQNDKVPGESQGAKREALIGGFSNSLWTLLWSTAHGAYGTMCNLKMRIT